MTSFLTTYLVLLPFAHSTLAILIFLEHMKAVPKIGALHQLFPFLVILFLLIFICSTSQI